jgi:hypothetical protein
MAKITIEFDSVEEADDARTALDGYKWKLAMWDLDQELRKTTKYGTGIINPSKTASDVEMEVANKVRDMIREVLHGYSIDLE